MKIKSIRKVEKQRTYDLNIIDNHNYFVGDSEILVHNCGKDVSKVDRSGAYALRWVAKNVVDAELADRVEVQVAYALGQAAPVGIYVETFGTEHVEREVIEQAISEVFDLRPAAIIRDLRLLDIRYSKTSTYGHFGRGGTENDDFTWEQTNRSDELSDVVDGILIKSA